MLKCLYSGNFNRNMLLARSNLRKAKGQTIAIVALVLLSSVMMNIWLMLSTDYKKNFDRYHDKLNDGHVNVAAYTADDDFREYAADALENSADVTEFSMDDAFCATVSFEYNGGKTSMFGVLLEKDAALLRSVGKYEITEDSAVTSGIYLPMLYGTGGNYSAGDTVGLEIYGEKFEYTVCGFFNNTMSSSPNCALLSFLLTEDKFKELSEKTSAVSSTYISVRIGDKAKGEEVGTWLKEKLGGEFPNVIIAGNNYEMITTSRYISQMICAGIMSAMAFLVLLIGIVVISSNVADYIRENMRNLGALKGIGYTSRQIISALIMQFSGISAAAAMIGAAFSYCIFPGVNEMMIAQTGIPYEVKFLPLPFVVTVLFILSVTAAAVYFSANKIKKLEPITAMRQGIAAHNFRKNHLPLEKTSLNVNAALAMKTMLSSFKQNVTVCVTMLVLSLIIVFSGVMFENVIVDMHRFIDMIAGEYTDSCIVVDPGCEDEFVCALESDSRVEKCYLYINDYFEVRHVGGDTLIFAVTDDCSKLNNQTMMIEGRFPIYDNEFAIGAKYAKDNGIKAGDELTLEAGGNSERYIVSGLVQQTNSFGKDCIITREGYKKLGELQSAAYFINLTGDTDIDDFNSEISEDFGSNVMSTRNINAVLMANAKIYVALMTAIVTAILIISCVVIIFVMYLLVRTLLGGKKRDYGILKALGFTAGQLVVQTAMSFMPSVIISSAVGIIISMQIINPLTAVFLSGLGVVKSTFAVPSGFNIIAGIVLDIFAFGTACLMSLRVKRIAPVELLIGE